MRSYRDLGAQRRARHFGDTPRAQIAGSTLRHTPDTFTEARRFVDEAAGTNHVSPRVGCVDQDRGEVLHPPEQVT